MWSQMWLFAGGLIVTTAASDFDFHLSIYAIHKATDMRNKNFVYDLSQIIYSTKGLMDETKYNTTNVF